MKGVPLLPLLCGLMLYGWASAAFLHSADLRLTDTIWRTQLRQRMELENWNWAATLRQQQGERLPARLALQLGRRWKHVRLTAGDHRLKDPLGLVDGGARPRWPSIGAPLIGLRSGAAATWQPEERGIGLQVDGRRLGFLLLLARSRRDLRADGTGFVLGLPREQRYSARLGKWRDDLLLTGFRGDLPTGLQLEAMVAARRAENLLIGGAIRLHTTWRGWGGGLVLHHNEGTLLLGGLERRGERGGLLKVALWRADQAGARWSRLALLPGAARRGSALALQLRGPRSPLRVQAECMLALDHRQREVQAWLFRGKLGLPAPTSGWQPSVGLGLEPAEAPGEPPRGEWVLGLRSPAAGGRRLRLALELRPEEDGWRRILKLEVAGVARRTRSGVTLRSKLQAAWSAGGEAGTWLAAFGSSGLQEWRYLATPGRVLQASLALRWQTMELALQLGQERTGVLPPEPWLRARWVWRR